MNEFESFNPDSFERLYTLEDRYFWFRSRNELIRWCVANYLTDITDFLEVGCGNGVVLNHLHAHFPCISFFGQDLFIEGLLFAKERLGEVPLVQMDIGHPAFSVRFDAIGMFDVLEHLSDDKFVLQIICGMLKRRGWLLMTVPQHQWLWSEMDELACHKRRYSRKEITKLFENAGFKIVMLTSFMTFLLPGLIVSRFIKRFQKENTEFSEFEIPHWLNQLFYTVSMADQLFIKAGVSLPVGGSLLILARKAP